LQYKKKKETTIGTAKFHSINGSGATQNKIFLDLESVTRDLVGRYSGERGGQRYIINPASDNTFELFNSLVNQWVETQGNSATVDEKFKELMLNPEKWAMTPVIIVAPSAQIRYNSRAWTKGGLHSDVREDEINQDYVTLTILIDDITEENGSIEYWNESEFAGLVNPKSPERSVKHCKRSVINDSPKGSIWVWDARLLHRSLPNITEKERITINCLMSPIVGAVYDSKNAPSEFQDP
jgi:hypothetical protein